MVPGRRGAMSFMTWIPCLCLELRPSPGEGVAVRRLRLPAARRNHGAPPHRAAWGSNPRIPGPARTADLRAAPAHDFRRISAGGVNTCPSGDVFPERRPGADAARTGSYWQKTTGDRTP